MQHTRSIGIPVYCFGDLTPNEHALLHMYSGVPGDHVDVGTYHGGSACTAALAKRGRGTVHTVDSNLDRATADRAIETWCRRNGASLPDIVFHEARHPDGWHATGASTALIDADHSYASCLADYRALAGVVTHYVMFHDTDHSTVCDVMAVAEAEGWICVDQVDKLAVYARPGLQGEELRGEFRVQVALHELIKAELAGK